jgi:hypothetical protein
MAKYTFVMVVLVVALIGMAGAANYMYEKASVKGVGYKNVEMIVSTQVGFFRRQIGREGIGLRKCRHGKD